jgi:hypothetical protein
VKVGDLVKCKTDWREGTNIGVVIRFDKEGDPVIADNKGIVTAHWINKVKVISESR